MIFFFCFSFPAPLYPYSVLQEKTPVLRIANDKQLATWCNRIGDKWGGCAPLDEKRSPPGVFSFRFNVKISNVFGNTERVRLETPTSASYRKRWRAVVCLSGVGRRSWCITATRRRDDRKRAYLTDIRSKINVRSRKRVSNGRDRSRIALVSIRTSSGCQ